VYLETKTKQRNTKKKKSEREKELLQNKQDPTTQQQAAAAKNSAKSFAGSSPSSLTNHIPIQKRPKMEETKNKTDRREY
jgi:hypothetical protein